MVWVLVAALVVWTVWVAFAVRGLRHDAVSGKSAAEAAIQHLSLSRVMDEDLGSKLRSAATRLGKAGDASSSAGLVPLRVAPVTGRQLRAVDAMATSAQRILRSAAALADTARADRGVAPGPALVSALDDLGTRLDDLAKVAREVDLGPSEKLFGSIAKARDTFTRDLLRLRSDVASASAAVHGLATLLRGPKDLLILGANNAEMRAGQGTLLSWGLLHFEGGKVNLVGGMKPISTFPHPDAAVVPPLDPAQARLWSWLDPGDHTNVVGMSPRFDVTGKLVLDIYQAGVGKRPDGVIAADTVALSKLTQVSGPVTVHTPKGARSLDAGDTLAYLLHTQYEPVPSTGGQANQLRREDLSAIAEQVLPTLTGGKAPVTDLADVLAEAGRSRNVIAYSDDPTIEATWTALGVDGRLTSSSLAVAVINAGSDKLDQFLATSVDLTTTRRGNLVDVTAKLTMKNNTPLNEPPYILGQLPVDAQLPPGGYAALVEFAVPGGAQNFSLENTKTFAAAGTDGPVEVLAVRVNVPQGQASTVTAHFTVPAGTLVLEPTARYPRTTWNLPGGVIVNDGHRRSVQL